MFWVNWYRIFTETTVWMLNVLKDNFTNFKLSFLCDCYWLRYYVIMSPTKIHICYFALQLLNWVSPGVTIKFRGMKGQDSLLGENYKIIINQLSQFLHASARYKVSRSLSSFTHKKTSQLKSQISHPQWRCSFS